jgi:hypothetical protein
MIKVTTEHLAILIGVIAIGAIFLLEYLEYKDRNEK